MQPCSALSLALGEPLHATASEASSWLLVEQPGPWGHDALVESRLEGQVAAELQRRAKVLGVKVLLVKPPGRRAVGPRRCFLGSSRQGSAYLEELELDDPAGLLELDLERLAAGERLGLGAPIESPLYLVCTNSRRDACCARLGRPLAATLAGTYPGRVWECSHLGGHRFAPNLVCLPDGILLGRAGPEAAAEYERARISLEHLRGRTSFAPPVQAADSFVRQQEGLAGVDDLLLEEHDADEVTLGSRDGRRFRVHVQMEEADPPRPVSCGEEKLERPAVWSLVELATLQGNRAP